MEEHDRGVAADGPMPVGRCSRISIFLCSGNEISLVLVVNSRFRVGDIPDHLEHIFKYPMGSRICIYEYSIEFIAQNRDLFFDHLSGMYYETKERAIQECREEGCLVILWSINSKLSHCITYEKYAKASDDHRREEHRKIWREQNAAPPIDYDKIRRYVK